ncbi:MAG: GrpB family protein [Clostridiaceae bacterium]|nr:GrpB family protein [Clostridiaceae bacterium]
MRSNERDHDKYAQVKRNLKKSKWRHVRSYADAKTPIMLEIVDRSNGIR